MSILHSNRNTSNNSTKKVRRAILVYIALLLPIKWMVHVRGVRRNLINYTLGSLRAVINLTNLADLQADKRGEEDSVWLEVRNRE